MRYPCALICSLAASAIAFAEPPAVKVFTIEKAGDTTYFHVELGVPQRLTADPPPRLAPQDEGTWAVVAVGRDLSFTGKWSPDAAMASLRLTYWLRNEGRPFLAATTLTLKRADAQPSS